MHLQQYQQYNFHYRSLISQVERKGSAYFQFLIIFDNLNSERWTRPTARMTTENGFGITVRQKMGQTINPIFQDA